MIIAAYLGDMLQAVAMLTSLLVFLRPQFCAVAAMSWVGCYALLCAAHICSWSIWLQVFEHSHHDLPLYYRLASSWTSFDGSFLLWVACLSGVFLGRRLLGSVSHKESMAWAILLFAHGWVICAEAQPFALLAHDPQGSLGMNPALRAWHVVFHPPILYAGFAMMLGLSLQAFFRPIDSAFQYQSRLTYGFSTLGLVWGGVWAYSTLGWGGIWYWDPVETAALIPWVVHLAMLHHMRLHLHRARILAVLNGACVLWQVCVVRSGILLSVHSFALNPHLGWLLFILAFIYSVVCIIWISQHLNWQVHRRWQMTGVFGGLFCVLLLGLVWPIYDRSIALPPSWFHVFLLPAVGYGAWQSVRASDRVLVLGSSICVSVIYGVWFGPNIIELAAWGIGFVWLLAHVLSRVSLTQRLGHAACGLLLIALSWKSSQSTTALLEVSKQIERVRMQVEHEPLGKRVFDSLLFQNRSINLEHFIPTDAEPTWGLQSYRNGLSMNQISPYVTNQTRPGNLASIYHLSHHSGMIWVWLALGGLVLAGILPWCRRSPNEYKR